MSQITKDRIETTLNYAFFAVPVIGLLSMASMVAASLLLGFGIVTGVMYAFSEEN